VLAIAMMNGPPSSGSESRIVKPPTTGLLHTEQRSFVGSCMVLLICHPPAIADSRMARE
jgi:hypothetical protein